MKICENGMCTGCMVCESVCPVGAISIDKDVMGFTYPNVDADRCVGCGACRKKCPVNKTVAKIPIESYAAYCKDGEIRKNSSSGGIFTLLSKSVLSDSGVVTGASFDDEFRLYHRIVNDEKELNGLRGSKYLQSETSGIWKELKELLDSGIKVLFCGTPCQCAGLSSFLGRDYDNLLTVDIVCHGVPSPKVWQKYLNEKFRDVKSVNFRDKTKGWNYYGISIKQEAGNYYSSKKTDPYSRIFLTNCALRECCYNCSFKGENYYSDITLGDFWGIESVFPEMNDDKGVSAVIVRTEKGKRAFESIKEKIVFHECTVEQVIRNNSSLVKSAVRTRSRDYFEKMMAADADFSEIEREFGKPESKMSIMRSEIKYRLKRVRHIFGK